MQESNRIDRATGFFYKCIIPTFKGSYNWDTFGKSPEMQYKCSIFYLPKWYFYVIPLDTCKRHNLSPNCVNIFYCYLLFHPVHCTGFTRLGRWQYHFILFPRPHSKIKKMEIWKNWFAKESFIFVDNLWFVVFSILFLRLTCSRRGKGEVQSTCFVATATPLFHLFPQISSRWVVLDKNISWYLWKCPCNIWSWILRITP